MVNANGYTQHLPALFSDLLQGILQLYADRGAAGAGQILVCADDGFRRERQSLRSGDNADPDGLAGAVLPAREVRRALLPSITLKEVLDYRANLKTRGVLN
ncbi:hypothetical protein MJ699_24690 [Klebsiella pneumoniae]|nr:hypothetical protein MJ699_24690 [Klebsiella pneumoniae]